MHYLDQPGSLLAWLRTMLQRAESVAVAAASDDGGFDRLQDSLVGLLERGGSVILTTGDLTPRWQQLAGRYQGQVQLRAAGEALATRVVFSMNGGALEGFLGQGPLTGAGLEAAPAGLILTSVRDRPVLERLRRDLDVPPPPTRTHVLEFGSLLQPVMDDLEQRARSSGPGMTGLSDLDSLVGHQTAGQLWTVNGPAGVGKTCLALGLARQTAVVNRRGVLWMTTLNTPVQLARDTLSGEVQLPAHHMPHSAMTDDDWARLARHMGELAEVSLCFWPVPSAQHGLAELKGVLGTRPGTSLVVVDALTSPTDTQALAQLSEVARQQRIWVVALMPDPAGLDAAVLRARQATHADLVMRLHREDQREPDSPRAGEIDLVVDYHRLGPVSVITATFQGHYRRIVEMA